MFRGPLPSSGAASLAADTPLSFKFATFTPKTALGVPPGFYSQGNFGVGFSVLGKDLGGNSLRRFFSIANICGDCAFSRAVGLSSGAPEPASWALMIAGFGLTGAFLRRRRVAEA